VRLLFAVVLAGLLGTAPGLVPVATAQDAKADNWFVLRYDQNGNPIGADAGQAPTLSPMNPGQQDGAPAIGAPNSPAGKAPEQIPAGPEPELRTDKPHEDGELLVMQTDNRQLEALRRLNFAILERMRLGNLGIEVLRLRKPPELTLDAAIRLVETQFPGLVVDTNDLLDRSQGAGATVASTAGGAADIQPDFSRELTGWGVVPDSCGTGMRIGMIDSLVDTRARAFKGRSVVYRSFTDPARTPSDDEHGTAVASVLVGNGNGTSLPGGLLPGAQIYAAGIFELRGGKSTGNLAALLRAMDWLVAQKVQVVNLSVAGHGNAVMTIALNKAVEAGLALVAAAGNNGPGAPPAWPAAHAKVIAVTAIDIDMNVYRHANSGDYIDFAAPGVNVSTATPRGAARQSGTSFATPFLTAMVAIHRAAGFTGDADILRASLRRYTVDLGLSGHDMTFGWGLARLRPNC